MVDKLERREIKFRAWNKTKKKMLNQIETIHFGLKNLVENKETGWDWYKDEYELMQYTELKDKDGKEIYEGDILEKYGCWSIRIEYDKGGFRVRDLDEIRYINRILDCHIDTFDIQNWKVVGNIYMRIQNY